MRSTKVQHAPADAPAEPEKKSWRLNFCPTLAVYFPKYVCIHNPQLNLIYFIANLVTILLILGYFITNSSTFQTFKVPDTKVNIQACAPPVAELDRIIQEDASKDYVEDVSRAAFWRDASADLGRYTKLSIVGRCGAANSNAASCMLPYEFVQSEHEVIFIPTFYVERYVMPSGPNKTCEQPFNCTDASCVSCTRGGNYYVPGADQARVAFNHEFNVLPDAGASYGGLFAIKEIKGHSRVFHAVGSTFSEGMLTVLFDYAGQAVRQFLPGGVEVGDTTATVNISLAEVLRSAYYHGVEQEGTLDLDMRYVQPGAGVLENMHPERQGEKPRLRMTGLQLTIDISTMGSDGECHNYDAADPAMGKAVQIEWKGSAAPISCLFVSAERGWTFKDEVQPIGIEGGKRLRRTFGVRIKFRKLGRFAFFNINAITKTVTLFFVWIQLPLAVVYLFTVTMLGTLSQIYSRVVSQSVSLGECCRGLVARLVGCSSAYKNLVARVDEDRGIQKGTLLDRYGEFLNTNERIDKQELARYVDFVYDGFHTWDAKCDVQTSTGVSIESFVGACLTNEPLKLDTLTKLVDAKRKVGVLETLFTDQAAREVLDAVAQSKPNGGDDPEEDAGRATEQSLSQADCNSNMHFVAESQQSQLATMKDQALELRNHVQRFATTRATAMGVPDARLTASPRGHTSPRGTTGVSPRWTTAPPKPEEAAERQTMIAPTQGGSMDDIEALLEDGPAGDDLAQADMWEDDWLDEENGGQRRVKAQEDEAQRLLLDFLHVADEADQVGEVIPDDQL